MKTPIAQIDPEKLEKLRDHVASLEIITRKLDQIAADIMEDVKITPKGGNTMSPGEELSKGEYKEVEDMLDKKFEEQREYLKETFTPKIECGQNRGRIRIWLVILSMSGTIGAGVNGFSSIKTLISFISGGI